MTEIGLIIAAGAGTRLADKSNVPKPLRKVCGVPLLRRIILTAAKGGLKKIYVVVGFQKEKINAYIKRSKWPIQVETIDNPNWKKSNGISVLSAKKVIQENFILMMSDHIFDPHTLEDLHNMELDGYDARLAVDYKVHQIFDKDDATKVEVQNGNITAIDKNLIQFNAIDTGMFLLSPRIFDALESVKKDDDCSLSDGIRQLAERSKMGIHDIGTAYWQDVDTKACLKHAEKILLNSCRKKTDGFISRNFNRYISLFISSYLIKTPITANQITFIVLLIGLLSGYLASLGGYTSFLIAAILFELTSILDGVDGEISKLRFTASKFGQWFDTIGDNVTYVVFIIGTGVGLYRMDYEYINILGPIAFFGIGMLIFVMFFYILKFSNSGSFLALQKQFRDKKNVSFISKIFLKLYFVIKRDFFATFFLLLAILGKPQWILFLIALASNIAWLVIVRNGFLPRLLHKFKRH